MSFRLVAAALAVGISIALSSTAFPRGEWPDGPNKAWFENVTKRTAPAADQTAGVSC